jgi:hypothetical protein
VVLQLFVIMMSLLIAFDTFEGDQILHIPSWKYRETVRQIDAVRGSYFFSLRMVRAVLVLSLYHHCTLSALHFF